MGVQSEQGKLGIPVALAHLGGGAFYLALRLGSSPVQRSGGSSGGEEGGGGCLPLAWRWCVALNSSKGTLGTRGTHDVLRAASAPFLCQRQGNSAPRDAGAELPEHLGAVANMAACPHDDLREAFLKRLQAVSAALGDPWTPRVAEQRLRNLPPSTHSASSSHQPAGVAPAAAAQGDNRARSTRRTGLEACGAGASSQCAVARGGPEASEHAWRDASAPRQTGAQRGQAPGKASNHTHLPGSARGHGSRAVQAARPGWAGHMAWEASRVRGGALADTAPSTWALPRTAAYASVRYVAPPDVAAKWGRSRLPGVPSTLTLAPVPSAVETALAERPFLRYADYLHNNLDRRPAEVPVVPDARPLSRPAQLAARSNSSS